MIANRSTACAVSMCAAALLAAPLAHADQTDDAFVGALTKNGIPVTDRRDARSVTIVTGHEAVTSTPVAWEHLAALGGTIVLLMAVERRSEIAGRLLAGGLDPATPVAVVRDATRPTQHVLTGRLDGLGELPARSPAVIVIGAVAARATATATLVAELAGDG